MGKKKCLSILLTIIFVVSSTFTTNSMEKGYKQNKNAQYNEAEAMEFYKKSSELVKKNWNDDYFDSLKIKVGSNYLTDESCINDYENKPNSNEYPTGFKYKDGLCYGSLIN